MKSWKSRVTVLAVAATMAVPMAAASPAGAAPKTSVVAGSARFDIPAQNYEASVHINAQGAADGQARGRFTLDETNTSTQTTLSIEGDISCLTVVGNRAVAGGTIVASSSTSVPVGIGFYQLVIDNGSPGTADQSRTFLLATPPTSCPGPGTVPGVTVSAGNYTVHDAS